MMKKTFPSILILFVISLPCFSNAFTDLGFHVHAEPLYFFEYGTLNEFVYAKDSKDINYKLSELNWSVQTHQIGAAADFGWKWIGINTRFSFGIPADSSVMYDSDWQHATDHSMKTNFSKSKNHLNEANTFLIGLNGTIPLTPESINKTFWAALKPSFSYDYFYHYFSGSDGEGWYGTTDDTGLSYVVPWDDPLAKHYEKGKLFGIDYARENHNLFLGLGLNCTLFERASLNFYYNMSFYTLVSSVDTHFSDKERIYGKDYYDSMESNFVTQSIFASLEFNFWNNFYIGSSYRFYSQKFINGITYAKAHTAKESAYSLLDSTSGSSATTHRFSVYIKYALDTPIFFY